MLQANCWSPPPNLPHPQKSSHRIHSFLNHKEWVEKTIFIFLIATALGKSQKPKKLEMSLCHFVRGLLYTKG